MTDIEMFRHELCVDFGSIYEMSKGEAQNFHEAFSHFHKVMTDINPEPLMNALWLQENFFGLHNKLTPKEMLDETISYAVQRAKARKAASDSARPTKN